jgi:hypothetical protein
MNELQDELDAKHRPSGKCTCSSFCQFVSIRNRYADEYARESEFLNFIPIPDKQCRPAPYQSDPNGEDFPQLVFLRPCRWFILNYVRDIVSHPKLDTTMSTSSNTNL